MLHNYFCPQSVQLSVRAIVAKGSVDQCVIDYCSSHNIVMVPNTPTRVLLAVAEASQADIATYVSECTKVLMCTFTILTTYRGRITE